MIILLTEVEDRERRNNLEGKMVGLMKEYARGLRIQERVCAKEKDIPAYRLIIIHQLLRVVETLIMWPERRQIVRKLILSALHV